MPSRIPLIQTVGQDSTDRGVSELLQFILIFAVVLGGTFSVFLFGAGQLQDLSNNDDLQSAENDFQTIAIDHQEIAKGQPHRLSTVRLTNSQLTYGDSDEVTATLEVPTASGLETTTVETQPLIQHLANSQVTLELGTVINAEDSDSAALLSSPPLQLNDSRSIITLYETSKSGGPDSLSGQQREVQVSSLQDTTTGDRYEPTGSATLSIDSPRATAWESTFERNEHITSVSRSGNTVSGELSTDELTVRTVEVQIKYTG